MNPTPFDFARVACQQATGELAERRCKRRKSSVPSNTQRYSECACGDPATWTKSHASTIRSTYCIMDSNVSYVVRSAGRKPCTACACSCNAASLRECTPQPTIQHLIAHGLWGIKASRWYQGSWWEWCNSSPVMPVERRDDSIFSHGVQLVAPIMSVPKHSA